MSINVRLVLIEETDGLKKKLMSVLHSLVALDPLEYVNNDNLADVAALSSFFLCLDGKIENAEIVFVPNLSRKKGHISQSYFRLFLSYCVMQWLLFNCGYFKFNLKRTWAAFL